MALAEFTITVTVSGRRQRACPPIIPGVITVVIPAHNEGRVIGRLLAQLTAESADTGIEVIVVANGCTDDTAEIAGAFGPPVRVVSIPETSKAAALAAGDRAARGFPRIYADADIEIGADDVWALAAALAQPGVLAAAPDRVLALTGRPWPVRWYYDVWSRLPGVRDGLFGRGVVAVDGDGHRRIAGLPRLIADDLAMSLAFAPGERRVVPAARVVVHTSRTVTDLLRRRIRAAQGVSELERAAAAPASTARTRPADLAALVRAEPGLAPRVALFLAVAAAARLAARRAAARGNAGWLRDESSRTG
jgi:hypothetical protein